MGNGVRKGKNGRPPVVFSKKPRYPHQGPIPQVQRLQGPRTKSLFIVLLYKGFTEAQILGNNTVERVHQLFYIMSYIENGGD